MKVFVTALLAGGWVLGTLAVAGPIVTVTNNGTTLANTLVGSGVTLSGTPTLTETGPQAGTFSNGPSLVGFSSGIILSTGNAASAAGNYTGSGLPSTNEGGPGAAQLASLVGDSATFDAVTLQFNFVPAASQVTFQYTFASAEYPMFVNSQYNDVFAFFVNGTNYALIPGTSSLVSVNSVNAGKNTSYFNKYNATGDPLPFGGETTVLTFNAPVNAGVSNSIQLAIADVGDPNLDSAVFIQAGSLSSSLPPFAALMVPEPATFGLFGAGLLGLALVRVSRRNRV